MDYLRFMSHLAELGLLRQLPRHAAKASAANLSCSRVGWIDVETGLSRHDLLRGSGKPRLALCIPTFHSVGLSGILGEWLRRESPPTGASGKDFYDIQPWFRMVINFFKRQWEGNELLRGFSLGIHGRGKQG